MTKYSAWPLYNCSHCDFPAILYLWLNTLINMFQKCEISLYHRTHCNVTYTLFTRVLMIWFNLKSFRCLQNSIHIWDQLPWTQPIPNTNNHKTCAFIILDLLYSKYTLLIITTAAKLCVSVTRHYVSNTGTGTRNNKPDKKVRISRAH